MAKIRHGWIEQLSYRSLACVSGWSKFNAVNLEKKIVNKSAAFCGRMNKMKILKVNMNNFFLHFQEKKIIYNFIMYRMNRKKSIMNYFE